MDMVYILYDDRYRSKALFSNNTTYVSGLKVKVRTLMLKFSMKVSNSSYI